MWTTLSQLFYYRLLFLAELLIAEILFCHNLRRRNYFWLRLSFSLLVSLSATFAFPMAFDTPEYIALMFFTIFLSTVAMCRFCFDESWWNILFCTIASFTVQHVAFTLYNTLITNLLLNQLLSYSVMNNPYSSEIMTTAQFPVVGIIAYLQMYFVVYWISYFCFADKIQKNEDLHINNHFFIAFSGTIILVDVYFNLVTIFRGDFSTYAPYLEALYNLSTCIFAILLQFSQLSERQTEKELISIKTLWAERKNQYELTKKNIDIINIKCHDLKHQIHSLGTSMRVDSKELDCIEKAVNIYDSSVKTGNEALDVILTEKALLYERHNIHLAIVADGKALNFMEPSDIYSLFGNAIDNAMEAVEKEEPSKRNVSLIIKRKGSMVSVHLENYFSGQIEIENGIPKTTKADKEFHGIGFISMKEVVSKYGGIISLETKSHTFNLNFLFPLVERAATSALSPSEPAKQ
jgi:hypothetical protein